jgi:predicted PurR-regulated permease PerM
VSRVISLIGLTVLVLALGYLFVQVMIGFLIPLFLAVLLTILFRPLHDAIARRFGGHDRIAAGVTTALILVIVLAPILYVTIQSGRDAAEFLSDQGATKIRAKLKEFIAKVYPAEHLKSEEGSGGAMDATPPNADRDKKGTPPDTIDVTDKVLNDATEKIKEWLTPLALKTPAFIGGFFINAFITVFALYYFLADGTDLIAATTELVPIDSKYQRQLLAKFVEMSRAVATATLVTAIIQGILAAIGYYFAGLDGVVLLMFLTTFAAFVPIVGSSIVWVPCALWLIAGDHLAAGIALAVWCLLMAMTVDNVLKPMILHGQANLHPLLALLSVLGGVAAMGPIGIFVGPMAVAFLQTGLRMLNLELDSFRRAQVARKAVAS